LLVDHGVSSPIVPFEFWGLELGGTIMLGNQDMLEKSVFPKEFKPCMSLIFSSRLSILLFIWESFPSGFCGVGGLGGVGGGGVVLV
jgi:hypothetical protein